jgi:hypothetical protein
MTCRPEPWNAVVRGPGVDRLVVVIWPQRPGDVGEPDLIAAVDARGVHGDEHLDAVPRPLCDLGSWHASVEPQRDAAVPQVVWAHGQWRGDL